MNVKIVSDYKRQFYKKYSLVIRFNSSVNKSVSSADIYNYYLSHPKFKAFVISGIDISVNAFDLTQIVDEIRNKQHCLDDIIIWSEYTEEELNGEPDKEYDKINFEKVHAVYKQLQQYENIIVKFGRYVPGDKPHPDELLGVDLSSDNQYAKFIGKPAAAQSSDEN